MEKDIIQLAAAFAGSLGFAMLFNIRGKKLLVSAFGGMLAWAVYLMLGHFIVSDIWRFFLTSMFLTRYAEVMARRQKAPDTIYIICSAIPLSPGGSLYNTMHYAVEGEWENFSGTGMHTLLLAAAIAIGILCMMTIMHVIYSVYKDVRRWCRGRRPEAAAAGCGRDDIAAVSGGRTGEDGTESDIGEKEH